MSVAGTTVLFIVKGMLISERCQTSGRSKHWRYISIGDGSWRGGFCWLGERKHRRPTTSTFLPSTLPPILYLTPEALMANALRIETRNSLLVVNLRH